VKFSVSAFHTAGPARTRHLVKVTLDGVEFYTEVDTTEQALALVEKIGRALKMFEEI
jgi:hypothetical protein